MLVLFIAQLGYCYSAQTHDHLSSLIGCSIIEAIFDFYLGLTLFTSKNELRRQRTRTSLEERLQTVRSWHSSVYNPVSSYGSIVTTRNSMNLRDADAGKILWQDSEDL